MRILIFISSLFIFSCTNPESVILSEKDYISIVDRDTSLLHLTLYKNNFYGHLTIKQPGDVIIKGEINGKIQQDTLIGDYLYTPYKWKYQKRRPIVLLNQKGTFVEGSGIISILLGVPHYMPGSISYDPPKNVFTEVK
ncbi:hypothetical protein ACFRAE_08010 [Sphingobacterium sp. HJSM2_6]|uniref:hypothetical protein n=1 Tax=Sphingobacterium sp. HJSM2_6 TaxID=3366264 RepID=UPI003BBEA524